MSVNRSRSKAEMEVLRARIVELTRKDPELRPCVIATRCGVNEGTVREVQRAAGLYTPRGNSGRILTQHELENA